MRKGIPPGEVFNEFYVKEIESKTQEELSELNISLTHPYLDISKFISTFNSIEWIRRYFHCLEKIKNAIPSLESPDLQLEPKFRDDFYFIACLPSLSNHKNVADFGSYDFLFRGCGDPEVFCRWVSALIIYDNPNNAVLDIFLRNQCFFNTDAPFASTYLASIYGFGAKPEIIQRVFKSIFKTPFFIYPWLISSLSLWGHFDLANDYLREFLQAGGSVAGGCGCNESGDQIEDIKKKIEIDHFLIGRHLKICINLASQYNISNTVSFWTNHELFNYFSTLARCESQSEIKQILDSVSNNFVSSSLGSGLPGGWTNLNQTEIGMERAVINYLESNHHHT